MSRSCTIEFESVISMTKQSALWGADTGGTDRIGIIRAIAIRVGQATGEGLLYEPCRTMSGSRSFR